MDIGRRHALGLLAGLAAAMALTPDNDQFSQFLRLAFFRSPNYQAGVSGWTVNIDGSAEFNNLTIRGTFKGTNFIINSSGAFFYSGTPALGNLIASIASTSGADQFGNVYSAGVVSYTASANAVTQLINGFLNVGTPGQIAGTGGAAPGQLGLASAGNPGVVRIDSGLTATGDTDAFVDVRSKNAQSSINAVAQRNIQLAGPLALSSEGSAPAQLVTAAVYDGGNGFARMRTGSVTSDTTVYQVGHAIFRNTADQTGIGTSATVITGLSATLGVGLYNFRGMVSVSNPTAGTITPNVGFQASGGLVAGNLDVGMEWFSSTAGTFKGCGKVSALGNGVSPTSGQAAAEVLYVKFDGVINVTTPGTLQVFALGTAVNLTVKAFSRIVHWQDN